MKIGIHNLVTKSEEAEYRELFHPVTVKGSITALKCNSSAYLSCLAFEKQKSLKTFICTDGSLTCEEILVFYFQELVLCFFTYLLLKCSFIAAY